MARADEMIRMSNQNRTQKIPHSSGVYQIRCIPNGKIYVGSSVDLHARWGQHRRMLQCGEHGNFRLQQAWDEYGEANFEFAVLEPAEPDELLRAEQAWIDQTACVDRSTGFNICPMAGPPAGLNAQVW